MWRNGSGDPARGNGSADPARGSELPRAAGAGRWRLHVTGADGLTLLELVLAVAVVAIVGLSASVLAAGAVRAERAAEESAAALRAVRAAQARVDADVRRARSATTDGSTLELSDRGGGTVRYYLAAATLVRESGSGATPVAAGLDLAEFSFDSTLGLVRYRLRAVGSVAAATGAQAPGEPVEIEGRTALRLAPGGRP